MKTTKLAVTLTTSALLAGQLAGQTPSADTAASAAATTAAQTAVKLASLSRSETRALLAKIERAERPEPKMGAMCYDMAAPPERAEYVCPTCGERTLYSHEHAAFVQWELEMCRRLFSRMPHREAMSLDESSFCRKCCPKSSVHELVLTIRFDDGKTTGVHSMTSEDLRLLAGALSGKLTGTTLAEGEEPLKNSLPRLRELLDEKVAK